MSSKSEHKRIKMDDSSTSDGSHASAKVSKGNQDTSCYVKPHNFSEILDFVGEYPMCLIGAKGVGKSSMLQALYEEKGGIYEDFALLLTDEDVQHFYEKLPKKSETRKLLFADNIQCALSHPVLIKIIRTYVKQPHMHKEVSVVAAVSTDGIHLLMKGPTKLRAEDFERFFLYPDENVTQELIEKSGLTDQEKVKELMKSFGWVAGEFKRLLKFIKRKPKEDMTTTLNLFKDDRQLYITHSLSNEFHEKHGSVPANRSTAIVIALVNGVTKAELFKWFRMVMEALPWTYLMWTGGVDDPIKPVSDEVQEAMKLCLKDEPEARLAVLHMVKEVNLECGGVLQGRVFEQFVADALIKPGATIKFTNYKSGSKDVKIADGLQQETFLGKTSPPDHTNNCCYWCPNLKGGDIMLLVDNKKYFIQCSVAQWKALCEKRNFAGTCPEGWEAILLVPYDCLPRLESSSSILSQQFRDGSFSFANAATLLPNELIQAVFPFTDLS